MVCLLILCYISGVKYSCVFAQKGCCLISVTLSPSGVKISLVSKTDLGSFASVFSGMVCTGKETPELKGLVAFACEIPGPSVWKQVRIQP